MPAVAVTSWTVDMLDEVPYTSERLEIIDGTLYVTPSPSVAHQLVAGGIYHRLVTYLKGSGVGTAIISPSDIRRGDQDTNRVQPDVYVVRLSERHFPVEPFQLKDLLLAIEVASPSNPTLDYHVKRELYLAEGVAEYWIASPQERVIARWRSRDDAGSIARDRLEWHPAGMRAALRLDVQEMFSELD